MDARREGLAAEFTQLVRRVADHDDVVRVVVEPLPFGEVRVCVIEQTASGWRPVALAVTDWTELSAMLEALKDDSGEAPIDERQKSGVFGVGAELAGTFRS